MSEQIYGSYRVWRLKNGDIAVPFLLEGAAVSGDLCVNRPYGGLGGKQMQGLRLECVEQTVPRRETSVKTIIS